MHTHAGNESTASQQAGGMNCVRQPRNKKKCEQPALNDTTNLSRPPPKHSRPLDCKGLSAVEQKPAPFGSMPSLMGGILNPQMSLFKSLGIDMTEGNLLNLAGLLLQNLHQSQLAVGHCGNVNLPRTSERGSTVPDPLRMTASTQHYPLQLSDPPINFQLARSTNCQQQPRLNSSTPTPSSTTSKPKSMGDSMIAAGRSNVASSTKDQHQRSAPNKQLVPKPLVTTCSSKISELSENSSSQGHISFLVPNHGSLRGQRTPLGSPAKLKHALLDTVSNRTVQLIEGKRRKPVPTAAVTPPSKRKGKQREVRQRRKSNRKQNTPASLAAHHTIPQYFTTSSPVKLLDSTNAVTHTEVARKFNYI